MKLALRAIVEFLLFMLREFVVETSKAIWDARPWKKLPPKPEPKRCAGECVPWDCHACRERLIRLSKKRK